MSGGNGGTQVVREEPDPGTYCDQGERFDRIDARLDQGSDRFREILTRLDAHDEVHGRILGELADARKAIGRVANPVTGEPASGLTGLVVTLTDRVNELAPRVDDLEEESEITQTQSREELVARAREAEAKVARMRSTPPPRRFTARQWAMIIGSTAAGIGAVVHTVLEVLR